MEEMSATVPIGYRPSILETNPAVNEEIVATVPVIAQQPYVCPISGRIPEACVSIGYREACRTFRDKMWLKNNVMFCCRLESVQAIAIEKPVAKKTKVTGGSVMVANKKQVSKCDMCGKEKKLVVHLGKKVCSMCLPVRIMVKNNPGMVITCLEEFGVLSEGFNLAQIKQAETGLGFLSATAAVVEKQQESSGVYDEVVGLINDIEEYLSLVQEKNTKHEEGFFLGGKIPKMAVADAINTLLDFGRAGGRL